MFAAITGMLLSFILIYWIYRCEVRIERLEELEKESRKRLYGPSPLGKSDVVRIGVLEEQMRVCGHECLGGVYADKIDKVREEWPNE